jgi:hypothetical protein
VCGWVRRNMLQPNGALEGGLRTSRAAYAYIDSTFIYGAHLAGQFDLSTALMPRLLGWQDERSGGFADEYWLATSPVTTWMSGTPADRDSRQS